MINSLAVVGMLVISILFIGMIVMIEVGRRIRSRRDSHDVEASRAGLAVIEGALFGLMGLILAFSFSGACSRFDGRRQMIIEEANAIGTAYLRLDLLPAQAQPELRDDFRKYVEARLAVYNAVPDFKKVEVEKARVEVLQSAIWKRALAASAQISSPQATMLLLPALNAMFDIANSRMWLTKIHPPFIVFVLMCVLTLVCALFTGFNMGASNSRSWIHIIGFALLVTATLYAILDIEYPRLGFIHIKIFDQALVDVRNAMK